MACLHITHLKTSYNDQRMNVVLGNVQAYVFDVLCWKCSVKVRTEMRELHKGKVMIESDDSWKVAKRRSGISHEYLLVPKTEPPFPVQPPTLFQVIGSI